MKTFNILLKSTIAAAVFAVAISCETVTNPEPIPAIDTTKTAIITGAAYANLDETNDTTATIEKDYERAPANTTVKVVLSARDFSASADPNQKFTYSTTVDGSGNFTIEVPATDDAISAEIYMNSFKASQTKADSTQQEEVFTATNPNFITVTADLTTFADIIYSIQ